MEQQLSYEYSQILNELGLTTSKLGQLNVEHFTDNEGNKRDEIVRQYFGDDGVSELIDQITSNFTKSADTLMDLGSGSGTFLHPVATELEIPHVVAFDATPKMLELTKNKFAEHNGTVSTVVGDMEQITKSLELNSKLDPVIPKKFTHILSTLALHHVPNIDAVLQGIANHLKSGGNAIIIDAVLSETSGMEPSEEHAHNGFDLNELQNLAEKYFGKVSIDILSVKCQESKSSSPTELFILNATQPYSVS